jgi:hypothetical protein
MQSKIIFQSKVIYEGTCPDCGKHQESPYIDQVDCQCDVCWRKVDAIRKENEKFFARSALEGAVVVGIEYGDGLEAVNLMNKDGRPIRIAIDYDSDYAMAYQAELSWKV